MATIGVCFDGLRECMLANLHRVINNIDPLLEEYKDGDYFPSISREDARNLFEAINDLRGDVGVLMCCYHEPIGMSDLSHLTDDLGRIEFEEGVNEDEE